MTKIMNRMTQAEHYKLCNWLSSFSLSHNDTCQSLAESAQTALCFVVTPAHIKAALLTLEKQLPAKPTPTSQTEVQEILIRSLHRLYHNLGCEVPYDLHSLYQAIPKQ